MKKLFILFIGFILFTSCNNDDDASPVNSSIVGEWTLTKLNAKMDIGIAQSVGEGKNYNASMSFTENPNQVSSQGTVVLEQKLYMNGTHISTEESTIDFTNQFGTGQWELSGNTITMSGQDSSVSVTVTKLTSNSLIFRYNPDETTVLTFEFSK